MKAFLVGLLFIIAAVIIVGIGIFVFPVIILIEGILFVSIVGILYIWFLGKIILFIWETIKGKGKMAKIAPRINLRFEPRKLYITALIIAAGCFCYSNSLGGDFIWDDSSFVVENFSIRNFQNVISSFTNPLALAAKPSQALDNYRPLLNLSFATDYFLWGLDPFGYHLTNLMLHILNGIFLYFLMLHLVKSDMLAAIIAIIFVVHPVQTEAVTWISSRANVQFMLFYLLSLFFFIKFREGEKNKRFFYYSSLIFFIASVFSKEMAVTLPFIIVLYDLYFNKKRFSFLKTKMLVWLPFFFILLSFVVIRTLAVGRITQCSYLGGNFYYTFLTMLKGIVYYLRLLFWPQNLCADYLLPVSISFFEPGVFFSALVLISLGVAIILLYERHKKESFFMCWFFITLLPVANLIPLKILIAERFLYLPSIGIIAFFVIIIARLIKDKKWLIIFTSFLIILLSDRTVIRNYNWENEISFFKSGIVACPQNPRLHLNLGNAFEKASLFENAEVEYKKALQLNPELPNVYVGLGNVYIKTERIKEAGEILNRGLKRVGDNVKLLNSLGVLLSQTKDYSGALEKFDKVLSLEPTNINALLNKGRVFEEQGDFNEAINVYMKMFEDNSNRYYRAMAMMRVGDVFLKEKNIFKANRIWKYVLEKYPEQKVISEIINEKMIGK